MLRIIGMMSGTSLDGVDAAWIETDGEEVARCGPAVTTPYDMDLRRDLRLLLDVADNRARDDPFLADCTRRLTMAHVAAAQRIAEDARRAGLPSATVLGFHGQTILHRPRKPSDSPGSKPRTWQIGDAQLLANATGCTVVHDFRSADVEAGGQGAPLVPIAHAVLAAGMPRPLAVLNLGGVGNVTWLGEDGAMLAFDTGPANGPLDDWVRRKAGLDHDHDGRLALAGQVNGPVLHRLLSHPYLSLPPPKSLDRLSFDTALREAGAEQLSAQDGAATLTAFAAACVAAAALHFPLAPLKWLVAGGGRHNPAFMIALQGALDAPVQPVEAVGWDGDALEAQSFGILAARVLKNLAISYPNTTGVPHPMTGGAITEPS